ncbi:MAG: hypothetical protein ACPGQS_04715 [Bradymonadia bacterium]
MLLHRITVIVTSLVLCIVTGCDDESMSESAGGQDLGMRTIVDAQIQQDVAVVAADTGTPSADAMLQGDAAVGGMDSGSIDASDASVPVGSEACTSDERVDPDCIESANENEANVCDGFDNDCDGQVDEGCGCKPGRVEPCFLGPPNQVNIGACQTGTMRCVGDGEVGAFDQCSSIGPSAELCDGLDNNCNGCIDEAVLCELDGECPGPNDPRTPTGRPFVDYPLLGGLFYQGEASSWRWTIEGGPCDQFAGTNTGYQLLNSSSENALFKPRLSGSYRVTLRVQTPDGEFVCSWVIDVLGPGLRVEMCYPESYTQDLDLYMMPVSRAEDWFPPAAASALGGISLGGVSYNACSWYNCEAELRNFDLMTFMSRRADWGHSSSPLSECEGGPQGDRWRALGYCANPRLDIDNNLSEGTGLPENINLDQPTNGEGYRIMIQNFSGLVARPIVNVYCGGRLTATYGAPPDVLQNFSGRRGDSGIGAMWRVAEVFPEVTPDGETTGCRVEPIHPPGQSSGYYITQDDPSF